MFLILKLKLALMNATALLTLNNTIARSKHFSIIFKHFVIFSTTILSFDSLAIIAPRIEPLINSNGTNGKMAIIKCKVIANPKPTIKWYRDSVLLRDSNIGSLVHKKDCGKAAAGQYFRISQKQSSPVDSATYELIICKTDWKMNNGLFTCESENSISKANSSMELQVFGKLSFNYRDISFLSQDL